MIHLLSKEKYSKVTRSYFNRILLFLCKSTKLSMSFSKLMLKSRSTAKTYKSLSRLSDIIIAAMIRDIIVGNSSFSW
jgi:hypothetical protein